MHSFARICKQGLVGGIAVLLLSLPVSATPPTPPVTITAPMKQVAGTLQENSFQYPVKLSWEQAQDQVILKAFLTPYRPARFSVEKNLVYQTDFDTSSGCSRKKKNTRLRIPIMVEKPGLYELLVQVTGRSDGGNGFSSKFMRYVEVSGMGDYRVVTPKQFVREARLERQQAFENALQKNPGSPDIRLLHENAVQVPDKFLELVRPHQVKTQLEARPIGPSATIRKYIEEKTDNAWSPEDPLTIRGRLVYLDHDGLWRPLVNVSVNIYDEDVGFDDHLGTVATDWSGNWSFSVNNNDGWLADGRDIYYTFKLENTRIRVQDCDGIDSTYKWKSAVRDDLSDGSVVDFGSETGSTNPNSMQIWNMLNLAWNHASTVGGRDPGFVDSCFPEGSGARWDRFWEEIDIPGSDNDAPDVVTHEYGHAVMWYAYGADNPSPGGSHSFGDDNQNASLAWSEGWATGFMLSLRPDGRYNWSEGDLGRNIENFSDAGNRNGNRNEGRVAAAINDMLDSANDDNGADLDRGRDDAEDDNTANRVSLRTMLNDTLWGGWHTDFEDFWSSLSGELGGSQLSDANEIMYYNYMDVPPPISCVATKVVALNSRSPGRVLEGLRSFRDHALKGFNGGRSLINSYYRNSPELALILLQDPELRKEAGLVINHFSKVGLILSENRILRRFAETRRPLIDRNMAERIRNLLQRLSEKASPELKRDMMPLTSILASVEGLDILRLQEKLRDIKSKHPMSHRVPLRQSRLNDASRRAASSAELEPVIRAFIPPFDHNKEVGLGDQRR